jgi:type II secretory pathway pseudopilin PulG
MRRFYRSSGFSVVELVAVILIAGILAMVVLSRFGNPGAVSAASTRDVLLSTIRYAQQAALGRSDVTFTLDQVGGQWQLRAMADSSVLLETDVSASGIKLETGSPVATVDTCAAGASFNTAVDDLVLTYDNLGNLASFSSAVVGLHNASPTFNGVRICVNDTVAASVCVSPGGYAYAGNCDD